jgi:hypothetical protein
MKITDLALLFLLALLPFSVSADIEQHRQIEALSWEQVYDEVMYNASEDATIALVQNFGSNAGLSSGLSSGRSSVMSSGDQYFEGAHKSSKDIELNLQAATDRFLETVYINFGVEEDKVGQDSLKAYLPVQMVVGYDGLYVHTWQNVYNADAAGYETREVWMPKIPYSYYDNGSNLTVNFTLDDSAYVFDHSTAAWTQDKRERLAAIYPVNLFTSSVNFDSIRRQTIIQLIQMQLEYYTSRANYLSQVYGQGYIYNIPMVEEDTWNNTIDDVCFISFLQGFTIPGTDKIYNTFGFGGTKLTVKDNLIGSTYNGVKYFHKEGCSRITVIEGTYNSKKQAASEGYRACPVCRP